jgi:hypothetical protein
MPIGRAADALRLDRIKVRKYIDANPGFRELVEHAQIDRDEAIEEALFLAASSGHVGAAVRWMEATGRQIGRVKASQPSEPDEDPLKDLPVNVQPLDPRRRRLS